MRIPLVQKYGKPGFLGQCQLSTKCLPLYVRRGEITEIVQSAFADRNDFRLIEQSSDLIVDTIVVSVDGAVVSFSAGRSSFLDGGMLLYRLNARTGEVLGVTESRACQLRSAGVKRLKFRLDRQGC